MNIFLWLLFMFLATLSALPLARLDFFETTKKYHYFKYLSIFLFFWTIITGLRYISNDSVIIYYATLTVYPLIFTLTVLIFLAIMRYLGKNVSKYLLYFLLIFFIVDLGMSYTNNFHQLVLEITYSPTLTYDLIKSANHGMFFYVHTAVCYLLLLISMIAISTRLFKNLQKDRDVFPFIIMVLSIVLGIFANVIHLFIMEFPIDPTYIALVVLTTILYMIFYMRDLKLILKLDSNKLILDNLREMYLLVDQRGIIISASKELIQKFSIDIDEEISFEDFKKIVENKAVIYTESKELDKYDKGKLYLHMMEKQINLPLLKRTGKFYLLYDETKNQKFINDINYIMTHDLMTKIYNRNYFETLEADIEANYNNYSLIMFDIDGLKLFNDYLGHEAGDKLLIRFANALKEIVGKYENVIPIRMGGDEFLVIGINKDMNDIEDIIYDLKLLTHDKDLLKHIGFSYGYAQNNNANKPFRKVMTEADANQYAMKDSRKEAKENLEKFFKSLV